MWGSALYYILIILGFKWGAPKLGYYYEGAVKWILGAEKLLAVLESSMILLNKGFCDELAYR